MPYHLPNPLSFGRADFFCAIRPQTPGRTCFFACNRVNYCCPVSLTAPLAAHILLRALWRFSAMNYTYEQYTESAAYLRGWLGGFVPQVALRGVE